MTAWKAKIKDLPVLVMYYLSLFVVNIAIIFFISSFLQIFQIVRS